MADKKAPEKAPVPVFEVQDILAAAPKLFGVQPEVMKAALYKHEGPLSKEDAQKKLDAFLAKKVN